MQNKEILDKFGEFFISKIRDNPYEYFLGLLDGKWKNYDSIKITNDLSKFNPEQIEIIKKILLSSLDVALHDFLFGINEENTFDIVAKEENKSASLKEMSDGLWGEPFGADGWIKRYSKYVIESQT